MITSLIVVLGTILIFAAFISIFVPIIPGGPILSYLSVLIWYIYQPSLSTVPDPSVVGGAYTSLNLTLIIILGVIHILVCLGDFFIPIIGGKILKFSSSGIWGSIVGILLGLFFFPPLGMILGGVIGTLVGELIYERNLKRSLRITGYAAVINVGLALLKIILTFVTAFYFFAEIWKYWSR